MSRNWLVYVDRRLYRLSHYRLRARWANMPMVWITQSGTKGAIWILIIVLLFAFGDAHARTAALASLGSLLLGEGIINILLKPSIARERPYAPRGPGRMRRLLVKAPDVNSWPSAHAGSSMAAAVPLAVAYPRIGIAFLVLAVLIGYSRVYVGVHYPFDVVAGAVTGAGCAALVLLCVAVLARAGLWTGPIVGAALGL